MAKKIKKQELQDLQALVGEINQIKLQLGDIEVQKHALLHKVASIEATDLKQMQDKLEEVYGKVNVNISDGSITEIKEDEPSKED
jgi:hypothetical protein